LYPTSGRARCGHDRGQARDLVAGQHAGDGGGDQLELAGQMDRAAMFPLGQRQDLRFRRRVGAVGVVCEREERSSSPPGPSTTVSNVLSRYI
jgi:hypothetical protein